MKRVMVVFGTRPEAIKMAPMVHALQEHPAFEPQVVVTAQHREMLDQILDLFAITPQVDLNLMQPGQTLAGLTARIVDGLTPVIANLQPDAMLVQGDTTTTFCSALSAFYANVPIGHLEAGLRTGDIREPFPEEMNRVLSTRLAQWHFAATDNNRQKLLDERVPEENIFVTGNSVIDALLSVRDRIESGQASADTQSLLSQFERPFILVTGHRRESFGGGFESICEAIRTVAERHPELDIVYPVHLNPNVQEPVRRILGDVDNIRLIDPLPYEPFVAMMCRSFFILTDSGGVQEEAPSLGKPVLVMRDRTERQEGLDGGVRLVGTDQERILTESEKLITDESHYRSMAEAINPYGDGQTCPRIAEILANELSAD
ncbi:MAG: non-hydrolyzing UDP-N-acetylglucosamine 2-epimerase [Planctomycetota bacterium]|jgi:UDP-N-acetylglucosamine 2-epimerase (non-hydrolysing)